jgi:hypothetical protein
MGIGRVIGLDVDPNGASLTDGNLIGGIHTCGGGEGLAKVPANMGVGFSRGRLFGDLAIGAHHLDPGGGAECLALIQAVGDLGSATTGGGIQDKCGASGDGLGNGKGLGRSIAVVFAGDGEPQSIAGFDFDFAIRGGPGFGDFALSGFLDNFLFGAEVKIHLWLLQDVLGDRRAGVKDLGDRGGTVDRQE